MANKSKKVINPKPATKTHGELLDSITTIEKVEGRSSGDTFKLWEGFREQALLWRILALLQMPTVALALIFALMVYYNSTIVIEPPEYPQPGMYSIKKLPDSEFMKMAIDIVNLIGTYQPANAERQFRTTRLFLWEPALSEFEKVYLYGYSADNTPSQLQVIKDTQRSQAFLINYDLMQVQRYPNLDMVVVRVPGTRQILIGKRPLDDEITYYFKMTTIPKSPYNPRGIVIFDVRIKKQTSDDLRKLDESLNRKGRGNV